MLKNKFLRNILFTSLALIIILPLYYVLVAYPSFINALTEDAKDESVRIASHLMSILNLRNDKFDKASLLSKQETIQAMKKDLNLQKIKAFSSSGENLYSTDPDDAKDLDNNREFHEIIAKGDVYVVFRQKGMKSLEDYAVYADVVETYVPIMNGDTFLGAFEIYYDVTTRKERLNKLRSESTILVLTSAFGLFILVLITSYRASNNMSQREQMEEELRVQSITDELTGIYNRRGFCCMAEQQLKLAKREKRTLLLLAADLDDLKKINDSFGHQEGDRALADAAATLKKSVRESDIVARIGGDEFAVLTIESSAVNVETLAVRVKENMDAHNREGSKDYELSLSIGIDHFSPDHHSSIEEMLAAADKLMYDQKRKRGKND